uniref:TSA: Wollemia nobilis Ref_Wollemi_Transcript_8676_899 transcribed RNA sequence n=1 Tax=Wollemia nobilis TaxID=56998 RepID=A0A0C9S982_9CONI
MTQVHPRPSFSSSRVLIHHKFCSDSTTIFTVWKKSLLFNSKGFTVFDASGNLVFRVDNYASNACNEIELMDHAGNVLITLRRKRFSMRNRWEAFRGDLRKPTFTLTKSSRFSNKITANVFMNAGGQRKQWDYQIQGGFSKPSCTVFSASGDVIAEVKRKEAKSNVMLGDDVFSLVVQPGADQAFVMGLVIILDQIS